MVRLGGLRRYGLGGTVAQAGTGCNGRRGRAGGHPALHGLVLAGFETRLYFIRKQAAR